MRWTGHVARMGEDEKFTHIIIVSDSERKRPLGRPSCRWENNVRSDLSVQTCMWQESGSNLWSYLLDLFVFHAPPPKPHPDAEIVTEIRLRSRPS
jgi:hypothetical protein